MATSKTSTQILLLLSFLLLTKLDLLEAAVSNTTSSQNIACIEKERKALLEFRKGLKDSTGWLSSWVGKDCCNWTGVNCSDTTGNVVKLDLKSNDVCSSFGTGEAYNNRTCLGGTLNPSLLDLRYLSYLDMSGNNFQGIPIPEFIGSLKNLRYLDLSSASFNGKVPPSLGNLSYLEHLDLAMFGSYPSALSASDLNWLAGLRSLEYLNLGAMNLSNVPVNNWFQAVNMLPSLTTLSLSGCQLNGLPESPTVNFTSLFELDLSNNNFSTRIPGWLFNMSTLQRVDLSVCEFHGSIPKISKGSLCNLRTLDLSVNMIDGEIEGLMEALGGCSNNTLYILDLGSNNLRGNLPDSFGNLKHLIFLRLAQNSFSGPLPWSLGNLSSLGTLDLSFNSMNGPILESIGQLAMLSVLDLYGNLWEGTVMENHFRNLSRLSHFALSSPSNSVIFNLSRDWVPSFSLFEISVSNCRLGPGFPTWLKTQVNVYDLTLSSAGISGNIPVWLWNLSSSLWWVDLSDNQLWGKLPSSVIFGYDTEAWVDLGFNNMEGPIPLWPNVTNLSLRNNLLSGPIPSNMARLSRVINLDLSRNFLNGSIPPSINRLTSLSFLDLSSNYLSGTIPTQMQGLRNLMILDLSRNNLSGIVPSSICALPSIIFMKLSGNTLSGELSLILRNCSGLFMIDLGENRIFGTIPDLASYNLSLLSYLGLRANFLTGSIPEQLCAFQNLHIIDLAQNNLSGTIPKCLGNSEAFNYLGSYPYEFPTTQRIQFTQHVDIISKGRQNEYSKIIPLVNVIDLSGNNLEGEIPDHFTELVALGTLNLSSNHLNGKIPNNIGNLLRLESLDLSHNNLSGSIPPSMISMTLLNHLNLSSNNLSGQIPTGNQFQTFNDPSIYQGNPMLCGSPLSSSCSSSTNGGDGDGEDKNRHTESKDEKFWFYVAMGLGFAIGFWVVCGSLIIIQSWRRAYFKFIDEMKDRIYVYVAIIIARHRYKGRE